ncbi:MAG: hypothetical protein ACKVVP_12730 [Chloroflexota bacterium]
MFHATFSQLFRTAAASALAATVLITPLSAAASESPIPQPVIALGEDLGTAVALPFELTQDSLGIAGAVIETVSDGLPNPE